MQKRDETNRILTRAKKDNASDWCRTHFVAGLGA
jgi:hypothetical protein